MGSHEKLSISDEYQGLFESIGLSEYDQFLSFDRGEMVSEVRDRIVYRCDLDHANLKFYLKIYRNRGGNRPLGQLLGLKNPVTLAEMEANHLEWLRNQGFLAPKLMCWGGRMNGISELNSFLITESMEGYEPLDEWLDGNKREMGSKEYSSRKHRLINACSTLLRDLHDSGFNHPYPYLRHFMVPAKTLPAIGSPASTKEKQDESSPSHSTMGTPSGSLPPVGIIDVDGAKISRMVSPRGRSRGLAELLLSSYRSPLSQTDRLRFYSSYCRGSIDRSLAVRTLSRFKQKLRRHPNRYSWVQDTLDQISFPDRSKGSTQG